MSKNTAQNERVTSFDPKNVVKIRNVTLPILSKKDETPFFIRITSSIYLGKEIVDKKDEDGKPQKPVSLCHCINMETGEECMIVVNTVLKEVFNEQYPNDTYVDKCFAITQHENKKGQRYKTYTIAEIQG